jgi:hypothetical protein
MVAPSSAGPPPATTRTGLPQVCASMQKKVLDDMRMADRWDGTDLAIGDAVIPAKAGIHSLGAARMDPGLRRDDGAWR